MSKDAATTTIISPVTWDSDKPRRDGSFPLNNLIAKSHTEYRIKATRARVLRCPIFFEASKPPRRLTWSILNDKAGWDEWACATEPLS